MFAQQLLEINSSWGAIISTEKSNVTKTEISYVSIFLKKHIAPLQKINRNEHKTKNI